MATQCCDLDQSESSKVKQKHEHADDRSAVIQTASWSVWAASVWRPSPHDDENGTIIIIIIIMCDCAAACLSWTGNEGWPWKWKKTSQRNFYVICTIQIKMSYFCLMNEHEYVI